MDSEGDKKLCNTNKVSGIILPFLLLVSQLLGQMEENLNCLVLTQGPSQLI